MSTKVCVAPVKPEWRDATTIGQLRAMLNALDDLGYPDETPVTYLHDQDHVWLETVDDVVSDGPRETCARVVDELGESEKGSEWEDGEGDIWGWDRGQWNWRYADGDYGALTRFSPHRFAPFTEVVK